MAASGSADMAQEEVLPQPSSPTSPARSDRSLQKGVSFIAEGDGDDDDDDGDGVQWSSVSKRESISRVRNSITSLPQQDTAIENMAVYAGKIGQLSTSLMESHKQLDEERSSRYARLRGSLKGLEDRIIAWQNVGTKKFHMKKQLVIDFEAEFAGEKIKRSEFSESLSVKGDAIEEEVRNTINAKKRQILTKNSMSFFEQQVDVLKGEIFRATKTADENTANLRRHWEEDVPRLYHDLREETKAREGTERKMLAGAMAEVRELQAAIAAEKRARQDTEEVMLRMMEDAVTKMQQEIGAERRERKNVETMLHTLLNDTCAKLKSSAKSL